MLKKNIFIKGKENFYRKFVSVFLLIVLLFSGLNIRAKDTATDLKLRFQEVFFEKDLQKWKFLVDSLRAVSLDNERDEILLYAEYGLIGYYLGYGDKKNARKELEIYKEHVDSRLEKNPNNATDLAFRAAFVGFSIWINPLKALYLASESQYYVEESLKYNENEPMPLFEWANTLFIRPKLFGGDNDKAIELYNQAIKMYETDDPYCWMYYHIRTWMGQVYCRLGDKEKAREIYLRILKENPDYKWVRDELLPDLDKEKKRFLILNLE